MEYHKKKEILEELLSFINDYKQQDKPDVIKRHAQMIVKKVTNNDYYFSQINDIRFHASILAHNIPGLEDASITRNRVFNQGKQEMVLLIQTILKDIEIDSQINEKDSNRIHPKDEIHLKKIFVVHGHNNEIKYEVARTLEKLGLEAIILNEQPNLGRTLINKFTDYSNVDFAIVIISADDYGYSKKDEKENKKLRPRQNVVFELGFFYAKLGPKNVFTLVEDNTIEKPGDFDGVVYNPYTEKWRDQLVLELKALGYKIDANKLFK